MRPRPLRNLLQPTSPTACNRRNRNPLRLHQGFQQRHGFRKCIRTAASTASAAGDVEWRTAAGVFDGQVGAVGDQEFDELIEAVFGGAVQSGLIRDGVRARHLTAAMGVLLCDACAHALTGSESADATAAAESDCDRAESGRSRSRRL